LYTSTQLYDKMKITNTFQTLYGSVILYEKIKTA
jgi:hypothetical protein